MKQILFILLLLPVLGNSQVQKYRAYETKVGDENWTEQNILVVIDADRSKIHIYAKLESDLSIIATGNTEILDDGKALKMDCVDQDGKRCTVGMKWFKDQTVENIGNLWIEYNNVTIMYRLKNE